MWEVRQVRVDDAERFLDLNLALDRESEMMLLEPGERRADVEHQRLALERLSQSSTDILWVAVDGTSLAGYLALARPSARRARHRASVVVGVRASHQRRGVASGLFATSEAWARSNGILRLELSVLMHNEPARRLYERLGFVSEGIRRGSLCIGGSLLDEVMMAKSLAHAEDSP
jgi:RimJ/RimL family protein N-acetyltransferase